MKQIPFTNNATTTLSAGITAVATTINLTPGHGARLPSLIAGQFFMATMVNAGGTIEIVKVTARATDALTVVRAQEGTAGFAFSGGDKLEQRLTAAELAEVVTLLDAENQLTAGGTVDALTATLVTSQTVLTDGMRVRLWALGASTLTNPTFNLTLGSTATGAITIVKGNNLALVNGDIPGANAEVDLAYNVGLNRWVLVNPAYALAGAPAGAGMDYWGASAPTGWVLAAGQAISRTTFAALFAAIGTVFGVGDGSTTFNVPDKRGRASFGKDDMNGSAANRLTVGVSGITGTTLGAAGGDQSAHAHAHGVSDPSHVHSLAGGGGISVLNISSGATYQTVGGGAASAVIQFVNTDASGSGISVQSSLSGTSQNIPPALVCNYIIKT